MRGQRALALGLLALVIVTATVIQALLRQDEAVPARSTSAAGAPPVAASPSAAAQLASSASLAPSSPAARPTLAPTPPPTATPLPSATPTPPPPTPTPTIAPPARTGQGQPPVVNAAYIAVVDEDSGQVLYEKGSHQRSAPASITKIVTAIVALERADPKARVKVSFDPSELVDSTVMGLRVGDEVTLEDLLYGLMLPSGNDAALAIADYVGGSKARFVEMMNDKVRELGLKDTQFKNPHGLDQEGHYTSAYDIVMLARYGMQHYPLFVKLAGARAWTVQSSRGAYEIYNLNRFLFNYPGADGVKIGYTDAAGRTIVASATRNGHRVYVGLLHVGDIVADTTPLMNWAFSNYTWSSGAGG